MALQNYMDGVGVPSIRPAIASHLVPSAQRDKLGSFIARLQVVDGVLF